MAFAFQRKPSALIGRRYSHLRISALSGALFVAVGTSCGSATRSNLAAASPAAASSTAASSSVANAAVAAPMKAGDGRSVTVVDFKRNYTGAPQYQPPPVWHSVRKCVVSVG